MPLAPGTLLNNRYRIIAILGQGGMGAVYRASDEHLHIPVAVKENLFLTEEYGRQFQREAHILAGLRHVNLPHVTDYFSMENQIQYLVMDFIEGEDLRQRMERMGALPERETILIGISICDALAYLHTRQPPIVHRDIKPGNIKVTSDGQAVLVDFGLAKIMQGGQVTSTGARAMTPGYSPPEQYGTARTDPRSDVYSLGATLYATLTGVIPEDGLARMTGKAKLTPVRELIPKINRRLAETIEQALEVDPDDRFQTADEFKPFLIESGELVTFYPDRPSITPPPTPAPSGDVNGLLADDLIETPASKPLERSSYRRRRKKTLRWTLTPILGVLLVGTILLFTMWPDLTRSVLAYFAASPTVLVKTTEVSSLQTSPTMEQAVEPTQTVCRENTPQPPAVETPIDTPSVELTLTPAAGQLLTPTATPPGGGRGQIAFASDKIGIMQVWLLDVGNPKNQRQITDRKDGACQPSWSPDGSSLAFISPCRRKDETYPGANIYTIKIDPDGNPDRSSLTQVTSSLEGDFDPAWAPDGRRIAFTSLRNGKSSIWVLNLEDLSLQELSQSRYTDRQPAWSPSGMRLAFVRQAPASQVWYMTDSGQLQRQFTFSGAVNNLWPAWSTDEQVIFYSQVSVDSSSAVPVLVYRRYEDRELPTENRISTDPKNTGPIVEVNPSPDGFWLTYESWLDGKNHDIYIMSANGSNATRLTTDPGHDFGPLWRPMSAQPKP